MQGSLRNIGGVYVADPSGTEVARLEAEILAGTVIIKGGSVSGNVRARRSIELYVPAKVSGTLQAPEVFMDKGVQFSGSCTMAPVE